MLAIRYPDGHLDHCADLAEVEEALAWAREQAKTDPELFSGAVPVIKVGTNPEDYQWETFEDAPLEVEAVRRQEAWQ